MDEGMDSRSPRADAHHRARCRYVNRSRALMPDIDSGSPGDRAGADHNAASRTPANDFNARRSCSRHHPTCSDGKCSSAGSNSPDAHRAASHRRRRNGDPRSAVTVKRADADPGGARHGTVHGDGNHAATGVFGDDSAAGAIDRLASGRLSEDDPAASSILEKSESRSALHAHRSFGIQCHCQSRRPGRTERLRCVDRSPTAADEYAVPSAFAVIGDNHANKVECLCARGENQTVGGKVKSHRSRKRECSRRDLSANPNDVGDSCRAVIIRLAVVQLSECVRVDDDRTGHGTGDHQLVGYAADKVCIEGNDAVTGKASIHGENVGSVAVLADVQRSARHHAQRRSRHGMAVDAESD